MWLKDANLPKTLGFPLDGRMTWQNAKDWAASLTVGGFNDWRLPTTTVPDLTCGGSPTFGLNCTGSEMGHLYNVEGITFASPTFPNLSDQGTGYYWSATEVATAPAKAFAFNFFLGSQGAFDKTGGSLGIGNFVWAVRSVDVAPPSPSPSPSPSPAPVPEPSTLLLLGSGLAGLIFYGRKRRIQP